MCQCQNWVTQIVHRSVATKWIRHHSAKVHPYEKPTMNSNSIWIYKIDQSIDRQEWQPTTTTIQQLQRKTFKLKMIKIVRLNFSCVPHKSIWIEFCLPFIHSFNVNILHTKAQLTLYRCSVWTNPTVDCLNKLRFFIRNYLNWLNFSYLNVLCHHI